VGLGRIFVFVKVQMGYNGNMGMKNAIKGVCMLNERESGGF
jgi:hypothetical protein